MICYIDNVRTKRKNKRKGAVAEQRGNYRKIKDNAYENRLRKKGLFKLLITQLTLAKNNMAIYRMITGTNTVITILVKRYKY